MSEIHHLMDLIDTKRLNDPDTDEALKVLRLLHDGLGTLITAVEDGRDSKTIAKVLRQNAALLESLKTRANLFVVAPAMTYGLTHMLAYVMGLEVDTTLAATVFGTVAGIPLLGEAIQKAGDRKPAI